MNLHYYGNIVNILAYELVIVFLNLFYGNLWLIELNFPAEKYIRLY